MSNTSKSKLNDYIQARDSWFINRRELDDKYCTDAKALNELKHKHKREVKHKEDHLNYLKNGNDETYGYFAGIGVHLDYIEFTDYYPRQKITLTDDACCKVHCDGDQYEVTQDHTMYVPKCIYDPTRETFGNFGAYLLWYSDNGLAHYETSEIVDERLYWLEIYTDGNTYQSAAVKQDGYHKLLRLANSIDYVIQKRDEIKARNESVLKRNKDEYELLISDHSEVDEATSKFNDTRAKVNAYNTLNKEHKNMFLELCDDDVVQLIDSYNEFKKNVNICQALLCLAGLLFGIGCLIYYFIKQDIGIPMIVVSVVIASLALLIKYKTTTKYPTYTDNLKYDIEINNLEL